jgi:hypothetical protein
MAEMVPMIATTINSSMRVKPFALPIFITDPLGNKLVQTLRLPLFD